MCSLPFHRIILTFAVAMSASLTVSLADAIETPKALVRIPEIDFGYVPQKSKVTHTFYLINDGDARLVVGEIKAGCSCTSVSEVPDPIAPGDSVPIVITFNTGRYRESVHKKSFVFTNDSSSAILELSIRAYVEKDDAYGDIEIVPKKLELDEDDANLNSAILIHNISDEEINVTVETFPQSIIDIDTMARQIPAKETGEVKLKHHESLKKKGDSYPPIIFKIASSDTVRVTVPIDVK
jgi:hypothetical protein